MKFLFDVGVGIGAENWLKTEGYDVLAVRDIDPRLLDETILERAEREGRIVVTMDKDFGELVYRSGRAHAGVLLLRMEDANGEEKREALEAIIKHYGETITGNFAVYQRGKLRVR